MGVPQEWYTSLPLVVGVLANSIGLIAVLVGLGYVLRALSIVKGELREIIVSGIPADLLERVEKLEVWRRTHHDSSQDLYPILNRITDGLEAGRQSEKELRDDIQNRVVYQLTLAVRRLSGLEASYKDVQETLHRMEREKEKETGK